MSEGGWKSTANAICAILGVIIAATAVGVTIALSQHDSPAATPPTTTTTTTNAPAGSTPAKTRAAAPTGGTLLGTYSDIELTNFYAVDLDVSPPKVVEYSPLEFLEPIGDDPGHLSTPDYQLVLLPPGPAASYAQCHAATRYTSDITFDQIVNGSQICVTTTHHRLARVTITHTPTAEDNPSYVAFNATIWQTPLN